MNPTSPSAAPSAAAGANFTPNPETVCLATVDDPCVPPPTVNGRFTGGGFQFDENDVKVTRGFTLHCDQILSNNFEVNWAGGNQFHIDKNPTTVRCTREGDAPNPPDADVNLIEVTGTGKLNGVAATIRIILVDHGEPGTSDEALIQVNGGTDLSVGQSTIDGGNIQAHFDQPHKK